MLDDLTPPRDLLFSDLAVELWEKHAPALRWSRTLTEQDVIMACAGFNALADYIRTGREKEKLVAAHQWGSIAREKGGHWAPLIQVHHHAEKQVNDFALQFGLNPAARARIKAVDAQIDMFDAVLEEIEAMPLQHKAARLASVINLGAMRERDGDSEAA